MSAMRVRKQKPFFYLFAVVCLFALVFNLGFVSASPQRYGPPDQGYPYVPNEVLVRFRGRANWDGATDCAGKLDARVDAYFDTLGVFLIKVPFGKVFDTIEELDSCTGFVSAEPNYYIQVADTFPNDPGLGYQYGLISIRAPQGWDYTTGSSAVTIAIIDSGVDMNHPDLKYKLVPGYDFVNNDNVPYDDFGHGTHVAGIAAASSNNGIGIAGVSWGARIMPVKVLNASGSGTYLNVSLGIVWAADQGAEVVNLSLGGGASSATLQNAVNYAHNRGVTIVAASGNYGNNFILYPARYPNVIAVGAVDDKNMRASFSNYGPELDLVAPGVSIYSTIPGGYGSNNGTSMATPYVAGLAAILAGLPGNTNPLVIEQQMETTALDLGPTGWDDHFGYGLIQMDTALRLAIPPTPTPKAESPSEGLPHTGFSTAQITDLPVQPVSAYYVETNLRLDIPALTLSVPIVGVPRSGSSWEVAWRGWVSKLAGCTAVPSPPGMAIPC